MTREKLTQELIHIQDDLGDKARKGPSEFPDAKYEYEAVRYVIKNIDKLFPEKQ